MKRRVWVVEVQFIGHSKGWETTVYVGLSREDARREASLFMDQNSDVKTRVRCYVPKDPR